MLRILPRIDQGRFEPIVYALHPGGPLRTLFIDAGVRVIDIPRQWKGISSLWLVAIHLCFTLRRVKPDILHFFLPEAYILGTLCSIVIPDVIRVMSRRSLNNYQKNNLLLKRVEYFIHRYMNIVLGNSLSVNEQLIHEGINKNKIGLIYSGVEVGTPLNMKDRQDARIKLNIGRNTLVFLMVANLIPYKGHKDLLDAFGLIADKLPEEWHLFCVGRDDGYSAELIDYSKRLGIHANVTWTGQTLDVGNYYRSADIGVLPSHQEGFSNSILEGMASCLPMIVSDVGGNKEAIVNGKSGVIVRSGDSKGLAENLLRLARNIDYREKLGIEAFERIKEEFSIDTCVVNYNTLYMNLLTGNNYYDNE